MENRGLGRDEGKGKGQEEGRKKDRVEIGGREYKITILKEQKMGEHKVVEDPPEM